MNQDDDNGVIPEKEERPNIDIKEEEVFTTETPLNSLKLEKTPKLLSCKYCTYTTRYQGNLVKHVRIHTGDKPYSCKFCGKRFASKSNHKSHETIHTGQKRLKCPHGDCTYRANTKECIAAHLMRCHGDSSVTLTPRRRKSTKSSTDKSPLQSPAVIPSDFNDFQNRQRQLALQEQSPSDAERSNDLSGIVPPWATHAYMQTLLPPTVEVKPTLEELAEYVGTLHEAETLDQSGGQRGETPDSVAASSSGAGSLVSTPGGSGQQQQQQQQHMRSTQQAIPSISTFIRNRNPADELQQHHHQQQQQQHNNMNPTGEVNSNHSPTQHIIPLHDEDSTNHSLNSQPTNDSLAAAAAAHLAAAHHNPHHSGMDHSSSTAAAAAAQVQAAAAAAANNSQSAASSHGGGEGGTGTDAASPQQGPGTPIDMQQQQQQQQQQQAAGAAGTDPMALVSDENRSSVLSIELLQVFSKFGLDPQVIVDTLVLQGKLYRCVSCNIIFPEYSTFVLHKGCHGNRHPYQCHFCQVIFPEKFGFLTHFMQCPRK